MLLAQLVVALGSGLWIALILFGVPGTWLALAVAAACEWWTAPTLVSPGAWTLAVALAVAGEVWEFLSGSVRARRAGAGRRGALGALGGGILGALVGTFAVPVPVVGSLLGGALGAFAGSALLEHSDGRELRHALRVGRAAGVGHALGMLGKLALGVAVWLVLALAVFWP